MEALPSTSSPRKAPAALMWAQKFHYPLEDTSDSGCLAPTTSMQTYIEPWECVDVHYEDVLATNPGLTPEIRLSAINWMAGVASEHFFHRVTFHTAVLLLDRCLISCRVVEDNIQALGAACMMISYKLEETFICPDFVPLCENSFPQSVFRDCEKVALRASNTCLNVITPVHWLSFYCSLLGAWRSRSRAIARSLIKEPSLATQATPGSLETISISSEGSWCRETMFQRDSGVLRCKSSVCKRRSFLSSPPEGTLPSHFPRASQDAGRTAHFSTQVPGMAGAPPNVVVSSQGQQTEEEGRDIAHLKRGGDWLALSIEERLASFARTHGTPRSLTHSLPTAPYAGSSHSGVTLNENGVSPFLSGVPCVCSVGPVHREDPISAPSVSVCVSTSPAPLPPSSSSTSTSSPRAPGPVSTDAVDSTPITPLMGSQAVSGDDGDLMGVHASSELFRSNSAAELPKVKSKTSRLWADAAEAPVPRAELKAEFPVDEMCEAATVMDAVVLDPRCRSIHPAQLAAAVLALTLGDCSVTSPGSPAATAGPDQHSRMLHKSIELPFNPEDGMAMRALSPGDLLAITGFTVSELQPAFEFVRPFVSSPRPTRPLRVALLAEPGSTDIIPKADWWALQECVSHLQRHVGGVWEAERLQEIRRKAAGVCIPEEVVSDSQGLEMGMGSEGSTCGTSSTGVSQPVSPCTPGSHMGPIATGAFSSTAGGAPGVEGGAVGEEKGGVVGGRRPLGSLTNMSLPGSLLTASSASSVNSAQKVTINAGSEPLPKRIPSVASA